MVTDDGLAPPVTTVPRKIRLMSGFINEKLKAEPMTREIKLPIEPHFLDIINRYCATYDYIKVMSTISFPAAHNELVRNVTLQELQAIEHIQHDLESLKQLLVYCKQLQIEALYELTCCAIACIFKQRTNASFQ